MSSSPVNLAAFNPAGDGRTNDTVPITNALAAGQGGPIYFPPGQYVYDGGATLTDGTMIVGSGRYSSYIVPSLSSPKNGSLFNCAGFGAGLRGVGFKGGPAQTSGCYVDLSGVESYAHDCTMQDHLNGIVMTGSVCRISYVRMHDCLAGGVGILADGGDTSQWIDHVMISAGASANRAFAGIRVHNNSSLMITNTSVLQQGKNLLMDPSSNNLFELMCNTCFFDTGITNIYIGPTNGGGVYRCDFENVWAGSATNDNITIVTDATSTVNGLDFTKLRSALAGGSGFSFNGPNISNISLMNGRIANNKFGFWAGSAADSIRIQDTNFGQIDGFGAPNTNADFVVQAPITNAIIKDNHFGSPTRIVNRANLSGIIGPNIGDP